MHDQDFSLDSCQVLHLESTTACNLSCPQCAREDSTKYQHSLHRCDLTVERCAVLFDDDFLSNLKKMFMCGNFGDPAAGRNTVDIYQWFRSKNANITLGMNTNGSLRNTKWWRDLAQLMDQPQDYVVFSIDGLADTNHIYRIGSDFSKIMENAQAFIDAGGSAHWDMLVFEHNQHQVDAAQQLAKSMGFRWFRSKISRRFESKPVSWLNPPDRQPPKGVTPNGDIRCHALREQSRYLAANGELLPCCFFGSNIFSRDQHLDHLLNSENFRSVVASWKTSPHPICIQSCSQNQGGTNFQNQWQLEVEL